VKVVIAVVFAAAIGMFAIHAAYAIGVQSSSNFATTNRATNSDGMVHEPGGLNNSA
jgi:hypothetical protein